MYYNMFFRFLLIVAIIAGMSISSGCSQKDELKKKMEAERVLKEQEDKREEIRARLREQVRKEQEKRNPNMGGIEADKQMEKKQRADAESCMKEFQRCTDACKNKNCEDECLRSLSICEKNLPAEFQTLKGE
jgi:hypothetical protein